MVYLTMKAFSPVGASPPSPKGCRFYYEWVKGGKEKAFLLTVAFPYKLLHRHRYLCSSMEQLCIY